PCWRPGCRQSARSPATSRWRSSSNASTGPPSTGRGLASAPVERSFRCRAQPRATASLLLLAERQRPDPGDAVPAHGQEQRRVRGRPQKGALEDFVAALGEFLPLRRLQLECLLDLARGKFDDKCLGERPAGDEPL